MFFYECIPAVQEYRNCYATNVTVVISKISYHFPSSQASAADLHAKMDRMLLLLENEEHLEQDNVLLRDADYVKSYVGISTETLYRLQRDGYICVAKRTRNKRYYRDVDVERLRNSYRG